MEWDETSAREVARELERLWKTTKADQRDRQRLYRNEKPVEVKDGPDVLIKPLPVRMGRYPLLVRRLANTLTIRAKYNIDAYGIGQGPERAAEKAERYLNTAPIIQERQQKEQINRAATRQAIMHGLSGVKTFPDPALWAGWPERGKESAADYNKRVESWQQMDAPFPGVSWPIAALDWYPLIVGRKVTVSMEKKTVPAAWVRQRYPEVAAGWKAKDTEDVTLYEFLDNKVCGYFIEHSESGGKLIPLKTWEHYMGGDDAPVALYEGVTTEDSDLRFRFRGSLDDVQDALELEDFLATRSKHVVRTFWQPTIVLRLLQAFSPDGLADAVRDRQFTFGGTNIEFGGPDGTTGETYRLFDPPTVLPDADLLHQMVMQRLDAEFPPAMLGNSPAGDAGYKANRDIQQAEKLLSTIADNLASGDVDRGVHLLRLPLAVSAISGKDDVTVYVRERVEKGSQPIGIKWSTAKIYIPLLQAKRQVVLDIDRQYQADAMGKWLSDPIRANRKFVLSEIGDIENPVEFDDQRRQEDLENAEAVRQRDEELMMRKITEAQDEEEGVTVEELTDMAARGEPVPEELLAGLGVEPELEGVPGAPLIPGAGMMPGGGETLTPQAQQGTGGPIMGPRAGQKRRQPRRPGPAPVEGEV